jgi:hypothetical protein
MVADLCHFFFRPETLPGEKFRINKLLQLNLDFPPRATINYRVFAPDPRYVNLLILDFSFGGVMGRIREWHK